MKNKSLFSQALLVIIISACCIVLTVGIALIAGFSDTTFFDFSNLNLSNMIPVLLICGFICCVVIGIAVLFLSRSVFLKLKKQLTDNDGGEKK